MRSDLIDGPLVLCPGNLPRMIYRQKRLSDITTARAKSPHAEHIRAEQRAPDRSSGPASRARLIRSVSWQGGCNAVRSHAMSSRIRNNTNRIELRSAGHRMRGIMRSPGQDDKDLRVSVRAGRSLLPSHAAFVIEMRRQYVHDRRSSVDPTFVGLLLKWPCLHDREGLVHGNLPSALQLGASLRHLDRRVERIGLDD